MLSCMPVAVNGTAPRPAAADFCRVFDEEMHSLYLLAFLLSGDDDLAEQCFVGGLEECIKRIDLSMAEPHSRARRAIVKRAVQTVKPVPGKLTGSFSISTWLATSSIGNPFEDILSLGTFERFVFVMTVLEGHSDEECQNVLRCSRQEVVMARKAALQLLVAAKSGSTYGQESICAWSGLVN
jgi:hypothetical protein